jgi:hypothetical protein
MALLPIKKAESIKKNISAKTRVSKKNTNIKIEPVHNDEKGYKCSCCEHVYEKQKGNFMHSNFVIYKGNGGYITTCKKCVDLLYDELVKFYLGNEEKAIEHICQIFGFYFHETPWTTSKNISEDRSRVSNYISKVNLNPYTGKTYLDTLAERVSTGVVETMDDVQNIQLVTPKTVKFFGMGFSEEEYVFLQEQYADWTTRHECKTKAQEELFKALCFAQLNIVNAQKTGNSKDALKSFQDLLGSSNLKPSQTNDNTLSDQNTFGTLIKKWENEKPIPEPNPEWKDVDGIVRYITVWFLGHLCKMMGIKNSYSRMYEEEMHKYEVEKPEYEEDENALFDAVFGNNLEKNNHQEQTEDVNNGDDNG